MEKCKKISIIAFVACLILSSFIGTTNAGWYSEWLTIDSIIMTDDVFGVVLRGNSDCKLVFEIRSSDSNYDAKTSALLSAYYAGHEILVDYSGDLNDCNTHALRFKVRP